MKIIVNNDTEAKLIKRFLDAVHEFGWVHELEKEDKQDGTDERFLEPHDHIILTDVFYDQITVSVDKSEPEMYFENDEHVTGKCIHCGTSTLGCGDDDQPLKYEDYIRMTSPEARAIWRCEDCFRQLCSCCSENLITDEDDGECDKCIAERDEPILQYPELLEKA